MSTVPAGVGDLLEECVGNPLYVLDSVSLGSHILHGMSIQHKSISPKMRQIRVVADPGRFEVLFIRAGKIKFMKSLLIFQLPNLPQKHMTIKHLILTQTAYNKFTFKNE